MEDGDKERSEENVDNGPQNAKNVEKKHKKRQKKILAELQKQIEFYFSEPNLQKDRFIRQKISESDRGCLEIETIASFNRMKQLCNDISLIVKAMKLCPSVEVIDYKWVKPSKPLPEPKNVDSVTVYVERLPSHADHNWIKSLFSACGNAVYVSLPRYKSTGDIKGFAFVEFEKESEAAAALEMFADKPSKEAEHEEKTENKSEDDEEHAGKDHKKSRKRKAKLNESENDGAKVKSRKAKRRREDGTSTSSIPDATETKANSNTGKDERKKIKRNIQEESLEETSHKKAKRTEEKEDGCNGGDGSSEDGKSKKRKRKRSEASDDGGTSSEKNTETQESDDELFTSSKKSKQTQGSDEELCTLRKKDEVARDTSVQDGAGEAEVCDEEMEDNKKKRRKRKKKVKQEVEVPKLRVIPKTEWLRLKKEYQKLQREAMKDAKAKLKIEFEAKTEQSPKPIETENEKVKSDKENHKEIVSKEKKEPPQKLEMQSGVVLKFFSEEKNIDKRQLRNVFSTIAPVAYLEKEDDKNTGHVRFATKEACDKVIETFSKTGFMEGIKIEKLTEKEDEEYWDRLNKDRLERFQGKKRNRNRRGRQKITKKLDERASKKQDHIHFED